MNSGRSNRPRIALFATEGCKVHDAVCVRPSVMAKTCDDISFYGVPELGRAFLFPSRLAEHKTAASVQALYTRRE
ncbi:hypothetical protein [[Eubacterium] cellulosolvens]